MSNYLKLNIKNRVRAERPMGGKSKLSIGLHDVMVKEAKVVKTKSGGDQLQVSYENDKGWFTEWFDVYDPRPQPNYQQMVSIGVDKLCYLLDAMCWRGDNVPEVSWYMGTPVKINIYHNKKEDKILVGDRYEVSDMKSSAPIEEEEEEAVDQVDSTSPTDDDDIIPF